MGRFAQADSVVPLPSQGIQAWDRYAYSNNNPVNYNDPTGHDAAWSDFITGFAAEAGRTLGWWHPQAQAYLAPKSSESDAKLAGRVVADVVAIVVGVASVETGGASIIGGTVVGCGVTLCAAAPVAIGVGSVLVVEGTGVAVNGAIGLGANLALLSKKHKVGPDDWDDDEWVGGTDPMNPNPGGGEEGVPRNNQVQNDDSYAAKAEVEKALGFKIDRFQWHQFVNKQKMSYNQMVDDGIMNFSKAK